jgi:hypothetical protein
MNKTRRGWIWLLLVALAIGNELLKPTTERTWHDRLFGVLPYDFRVPMWARIKQSLWNPQSERIFVPQVFGIGWSINVGSLLKRAGLVGGAEVG